MKGNNKNMRGHPNGGNRHLRTKKGSSGFGSGGSNSSNWRETKNNTVNELTTNGYNNHYLTSAFVSLIGLNVEVQKTDGHIYEGILECVSNNLEIHLCHAYQKSVNGESLENGNVDSKRQDTLMFQFCDVVRCQAKNVDLDFAKRQQILTDTAISGGTGPLVERQLVQWNDADANTNLEALQELESGGNTNWEFEDMIQQNKDKHGYESTFDVTMSTYMTPMETCDEETYKKREQEAEKLAREMQKDSRHKDLETVDSGVGEEELFSSVSRSSSNSSFTGSPRNQKPGGRGGRGGAQPPRFQKARNQDDTYVRGGQHSNRIPNGLPPRHAQQQQVNQPYGGDNANRTNNSNNSNASEPPPLKSYSAVAARKQTNSVAAVPITNNNNIVNNAKAAAANPRSSPVGVVTASPSDPVPTSIPNKGLPKQEHLNHAKQQYIADAQRKAAAGALRGNTAQAVPPPVTMNSQEYPATVTTSVSVLPTTRQQPVVSTTANNDAAGAKMTASYSRMATAKPEPKSALVSGLVNTPRSGELSKYGKVIPINKNTGKEEETGYLNRIESLKQFGDTFTLKLATETPATSTTTTKSVVEPTITKSVESVTSSAPAITDNVSSKAPVISENTITTTITTTTLSSSVITTTSTRTTTTTTSAAAVSTVLATSTTTTSAVVTSKLNPSAKEFNFNPKAKEFRPTFTSKSPAKHAQATDYTPVPPPQYIQQQQGTPIMISQPQTVGPQEMMQPQYVQQPIRPQSVVYRPSYPAMYEVPNNPSILNNPTHPNGYVQQQMFVLNANPAAYHQQQIMNNQQGQSFVPMPNQQFVRVLNTVQQRMPTSNFTQDGVIPSSYILQNAASQSVTGPQQSLTGSHAYQQQPQTPSSPAATQHPHALTPHQQYVINNQNSNYHQSHINHSMHSQGAPYQRPAYSQGQQQPILVYPPNYPPGNPSGMIHNFQPGN